MVAANSSGVRRPGTAELIALAIWFALAASVVELLNIGFRSLVLGQLIYRAGAHLIWMIPAANIVTFVVPALLLAAIARIWPAAGSLRVALTVFAGLASLAVFLLGALRIHWIAILLLAAGAGLQAGTILARRYAGFKRLVRWTLPAGCLAVLVSAAAIPIGRHVRERLGLNALPTAPASAPNIIFIILDTVREVSLSLADTSLHTTPHLARWAKRGVFFERAIAPAPWTLPSHASMFTGLYGPSLPAFTRHGKGLADDYTTVAELLEANGYASAGFSANRVLNRASGLAQGFLHFEAFDSSIPQIANTPNILRRLIRSRTVHRLLNYYNAPGRKDASQLQSDFFNWITQHRGDRPIFAYLNFFDAHAPYLPPSPFDTMFNPDGAERAPVLPDRLKNMTATDSASTRVEYEAYLGAIAYLDEQLGELLDEMERRGLLDNSVIIIASDHGEEFGEHGGFGHAQSLYTELLSVPLLIIAPERVPAGVRVKIPVSLIDLPSTILDFAGVPQGEIGGNSLRDLWETTTPPEPVWSDRPNQVSVVNGSFHYILGPRDREELYDRLSDPGELHNLAGDSAAFNTLRLMRRLGRLTPALRRRGGKSARANGPRKASHIGIGDPEFTR